MTTNEKRLAEIVKRDYDEAKRGDVRERFARAPEDWHRPETPEHGWRDADGVLHPFEEEEK